jgi:hypothetical protein
MLSALAELERGALSCQPQPSAGVTYAAKIDKGETRSTSRCPRARCTIACAGCRRRRGLGRDRHAGKASA